MGKADNKGFNDDERRAALCKEFDESDLEWRLGPISTSKGEVRAMVFPYVTSRAVMDRLDEVFGPAGWQTSLQFPSNYNGLKGDMVFCSLTTLWGETWVTKMDGAPSTTIEPGKGGISDALKRVAVQLGIGRYLYRLGQIFVNEVKTGPADKTDRVKTGDGYRTFRWNVPSLVFGQLADKMEELMTYFSPGEENAGATPPPELIEAFATLAGKTFIKKQVNQLKYFMQCTISWSYKRGLIQRVQSKIKKGIAIVILKCKEQEKLLENFKVSYLFKSLEAAGVETAEIEKTAGDLLSMPEFIEEVSPQALRKMIDIGEHKKLCLDYYDSLRILIEMEEEEKEAKQDKDPRPRSVKKGAPTKRKHQRKPEEVEADLMDYVDEIEEDLDWGHDSSKDDDEEGEW
jgi:hypothetical protein